MIEGQCLCGAVYYRYHAEIQKTILCFCQHCRRAQGSIMGWNSPVAREHFEVVRGLKYLKEYFLFILMSFLADKLCSICMFCLDKHL